MKHKHYLKTMSWVEIADRIKQNPIAVIPTGSTENHGPHLPLHTDTYIIDDIIRRALTKLDEEPPVLITPTIPVGCSFEHMDFAGTISFRAETYIHLIVDYIRALHQHGIKRFLIANGHGGNTTALQTAVLQLRNEDHLMIHFTDWFQLTKGEVLGDHAGEVETSMMLAIHPDLVDVENLPKDEVAFAFGSGLPMTTPFPRVKTVSEKGYFGNPSKASQTRGDEILELAATKMTSLLKQFP